MSTPPPQQVNFWRRGFSHVRHVHESHAALKKNKTEQLNDDAAEQICPTVPV